MGTNPSVNRCLDDKAMDRIDHALGRPVWPLRETYRNHFATDATGTLAVDFAFSCHWERLGQSGDMAFFAVSEAGRKALSAYLVEIGDQYRAFVVSYEGYEQIVPARSRSAARYAQYLTISDCFSDLTFAEFIGASSVRLA